MFYCNYYCIRVHRALSPFMLPDFLVPGPPLGAAEATPNMATKSEKLRIVCDLSGAGGEVPVTSSHLMNNSQHKLSWYMYTSYGCTYIYIF